MKYLFHIVKRFKDLNLCVKARGVRVWLACQQFRSVSLTSLKCIVHHKEENQTTTDYWEAIVLYPAIIQDWIKKHQQVVDCFPLKIQE